jgi:glycogen(starch) synthase
MPPPRSRSKAPPPPHDTFLFEISWEVCNQVGGIYQVLRSKARSMCERWGDDYVLLGPRVPEMLEIEIDQTPANDWLADVIKEMEGQGLTVTHGRWLVAGRPRTILIQHQLPAERVEMLRHR